MELCKTRQGHSDKKTAVALVFICTQLSQINLQRNRHIGKLLRGHFDS